ncbi:hypothetical protein BGX31_005735, partial [Mortierella sp. GBA43]
MLMRTTGITYEESCALIDGQSDNTLAIIYQYLCNPDANVDEFYDSKPSLDEASSSGSAHADPSMIEPDGVNEPTTDTPSTVFDALDVIAKAASEVAVWKTNEGGETKKKKETRRSEKDKALDQREEQQQHKRSQRSKDPETASTSIAKTETKDTERQSEVRDENDSKESSRTDHGNKRNDIESRGGHGKVNESDVEQVPS